MNKDQFLQALRGKLWGLSADDIAERIAFYSEAIDDRMEDGSTEEEAVAQLGTVDEIAGGILKEIPTPPKAEKKSGSSPMNIVLLAVGSPIWFALLTAAFAVIWSLVVSFWSVGVALVASGLILVAGTVLFCVMGKVGVGLFVLGVGLFCIGLGIFAILSCVYATKGAAMLMKKLVLWIVDLFVHKEDKI